MNEFQPTMLGQELRYEDGTTGMITDEDETRVYIESEFYTGWVTKETFARFIENL